MEQKNHMQGKAELWLILVSAIWGSGFIGTRIAMDQGLSPSFVLMTRFAISVLIFGAVFYRHLRQTLDRRHLIAGASAGLFLFLGYFVQTLGLKYTTPANTAFLSSTSVVMVPFLWWAVAKKRPGVLTVISSILCFIGAAILSVDFSSGFSIAVGDLFSLMCAVFYAVQCVLVGRYVLYLDVRTLLFVQFGTTTLLSLVTFLLGERDFGSFCSLPGMAAVLYLGVFGTCVCYFIQTSAQRYVTPMRMSIIMTTESLFGSLFSVLLGYDKLTLSMVTGGLIIVGSILLPELQELLQRRAPAQSATGEEAPPAPPPGEGND
ncbi:DMT family transporter [Provencibacterium massiliense]|uniref:DMT family transporter n=1 Tax=Provencibacterium massiliense TaxID=1841868 RepID=UPI0013564133|nr:DMT family transporter [Provencibacterium massiliense]